LLSMPAKYKGKLPGIVVIHENRGLNPYIEEELRNYLFEDEKVGFCFGKKVFVKMSFYKKRST